MRSIRMRSSIHLALALTAFTLSAPLAQADTVVKRNGQRVEGEIIEQTADKVVLKTKFGQIDIPRSEIQEIVTGRTSAEIYKERWGSVDKSDALQLLELAEWCDENKLSRESNQVYRRVLTVDPDNAQARDKLGYTRLDGDWVSRKDLAAIEKKKREEEAKARREASAAAKGKDKDKDKSGKSARSGDIVADLGDVSADTQPFLDEIKTNAENDQKIAVSLEDFFGQKFSVGTTTHFSLRAQLPPTDVHTHLALAEKFYVRCNRLFGLAPDVALWKTPMQFFHVKQKGTYIDLVDWIDDEVSEMDGETKKFFKDGGGMNISGIPLSAQYERDIPLAEAMAHWIGQNWMVYYSRGASRPWMNEGFAMFTAISEYGTNRLYCSTNTKYANNIEIADKNSDSAYQLVCYDIIDGALEKPYPWLEMVEKDLNTLDFADLAKSWSIVDFLIREHLEEFKKYISLLPRYEREEDVLRQAFGWTGEELDGRWKEYVTNNYSRTP